ncbi:MAG: arsenite methyltransferase [Candidatus Omnitrophota bacterium]
MGRKAEEIKKLVRDGYAKVVTQGTSCCSSSSCCTSANLAQDISKSVGYSDEEMSVVPEGANLGLGCGNPVAIASLKEGEVVLDLGSGGGFDVFLAAQKVGPAGRVVGVDMTPEMVGKARRNIPAFRKRTGLDNVEFRLGEIEHLPVADASVDIVISNCVINLSPDKPQVWREIVRVLKPGGRVAVSDLALLRPLPEAIRESVAALVGCIAGAVFVDDTRKMATAAGLVNLVLTPKPDYVENMADWNDPSYRTIRKHFPKGRTMSDYIVSLYLAARRPGAGGKELK